MLKDALAKNYLLQERDPTKHIHFHNKLLRLMKSVIRHHSGDFIVKHEQVLVHWVRCCTKNIKNPIDT